MTNQVRTIEGVDYILGYIAPGEGWDGCEPGWYWGVWDGESETVEECPNETFGPFATEIDAESDLGEWVMNG